MSHAIVFPGQGSQFMGMGKILYDENENAKSLFEQANDILGFRISDVMFTGSSEELTQTNVTQPAVFYIPLFYKTLQVEKPDMVPGIAREFSALVANDCLSLKKRWYWFL